ncbi:AAA family ATPase [Cellulomonas timonensis]|uniref:AAA family ATPase n=1 Tax=Cellulomonas timonensis TaxID=1689271 RepID=UPI00082E38DD|nr:AAA family ATPase [Cellulomonas timonensis]
MAGIVVIGCADQSLAYELRAQLAEAADVEVVAVAETTTELTALVLAHEPQVVLVHDQLGPEPAHQVIRDLGLRRPASVALVVSSDNDPESLSAAMDAGARGVVAYPLAYAEVQQRVVNALEWSRHMGTLLASSGTGDGSVRGRATVVAVAGSKGGVGTTTIATHLCWDIRREVPAHKVLVVDLDLEKGDVSSLVAARYRSSVADLAKVSQDLSVRTVQDAVFEHESGLHLLLPPEDVREVEFVTPAAVRQIIALLRQQYDLVVIDVGAHVTPVQAAVVEIAAEVVAVVTPDLVSLRALRRNLGWWESLAVRKPENVHVLLNRHNRSDEVQPETARRISPAPLLQTVMPDLGRRLERATNSRSPELVDDAAWWKALRAFGREIGAVRRAAQPAGPDDVAGLVEAESRRRPRRGPRRGDDTGSASVDLLGVLPWLALVCALLWQLGVTGMTYVWTGHAASAAARSVALHADDATVRQAAQDVFPAGMRARLDVGVGGPDRSSVSVAAQVPLMMPGVFSTPWDVRVDRQVVSEP